MKFSKFLTAVSIASIMTALYGGVSSAAVSADEAKQLGANLTLIGAEKAGNKDGSIPEYTGGLPNTTNPPGFVKDSGKWPSPFRDEKPLFSITGQNAAKYADKLSEVTKELLKRYPSFRLDVYPTHRTASFPKWYLDATLRNATEVKTASDGLVIENMAAGLPFPIPKTGREAVWNHEMRWQGPGYENRVKQIYVDPNGNRVLGGEFVGSYNYPNQVPGLTPEQLKKNGGWFYQAAYNFLSPVRVLGDGIITVDNIDPVTYPRKAYQYSASTRRVRLSPDIAYDTPVASIGGVAAYDEGNIFMGKMDRFDFKLIGKKELYIPYNLNDMEFYAPEDKLFTGKHINPDYMRWELHRVWVIEATVKPGLRHIYSKRIFYFDEDWSGGGTSDEYDGSGKLYKGIFATPAPAYDKQTTLSLGIVGYDLATGVYCHSIWLGDRPGNIGYQKIRDTPFPPYTYTPDALVARSKQ